MKCIYCWSDTEVTNSRPRSLDPSIWRRRQCKSCVAQFSTNELPDYSRSISVKTESGEINSFSRDKLFLSIHRAVGHRDDALNSATELTDTVISTLIRKNQPNKGLVTTKDISNISHLTIKRYDNLAAHTYLAYHRKSI